MTWLRAITTWLTANWRHTCQLRMAWIALLVLAVAFVYVVNGWPDGPVIDRLRYAGTMLEILGLVLVAFGIEQTRKLFGLPSSVGALWAWLKGWPIMGPQKVTGVGALASGSVQVAGSAVGMRLDGNTVEGRLAAIEENIERIDRDIAATNAKLQAASAELRQTMAQEREERQKQTTQISNLLRAAHTGGLAESMAGLVWLLFGVSFANAPEFWAWLLRDFA